KLPIPNIPKSYKIHKENINYLINLPHQKRYIKDKKLAVTTIQGKEYFITEFLFAKQRGYIKNYDGHVDLDIAFYKIIPFIESHIYIVLENCDDKRVVYGANLDDKRTLLIATNDDIILSVLVQNNKNLAKQIKNGRLNEVNQLGETTSPLTLNCPAGSCSKAFWRQTDLIQLLYQNLESKSISQEPFIALVDTIIASKEKIAKYNKHFESLNVDDKIEIKEKIENLENLVKSSIEKIDNLVYDLYGLSSDEIKKIEKN
nr:hypothetical protein [Sulfurospirillum sp.]